MAFSSENCLRRMYGSPYVIDDPGDGGIILIDRQGGICEMESGASNETRTIYPPTKPGIRCTIRLMTDGGGDVVLASENGFNAALETHATFADAGDMLSLISVTTSTDVFRWEILEGNVGSVAIATSTGTSTSTASASSSTTATTTPSASTTKSSTSTSTQSISGSDTASGTFSASATSTTSKSATGSSTTTPSSTASASTSSTATATGTP